MSDRSSATQDPPGRKRRARGAPRRLLLESANELFAKQDYRSTTTREIADRAGVFEHQLFRNFGSKAALFREAVVAPFVDLVERFDEQWQTLPPDATEEEVGAQFIGALYDLLVANRGLVSTLVVADALGEEERQEMGLDEIGRSLSILGGLGAEGVDRLGLRSQPDLAARSSVAMVMGAAAFGGTLFGARRPSRKAIIEELTSMTLHGFLHRP